MVLNAKNIKVNGLNNHKILTFIIYLILKFVSYLLFTPFVLLFGVELILLVVFIFNSGFLDLNALINFINPFLINLFGVQEVSQHFSCSGDECTEQLKTIVWRIFFFITIIFSFFDFLSNKIFKKDLKVNLSKIVKYIIIGSYILAIILMYISGDFQTNFFLVSIGIIPLLLYVYFSTIISINFNNWANLIFDGVFINGLEDELKTIQKK